MQKLPQKFAKKNYEKINGKHFNLLPRLWFGNCLFQGAPKEGMVKCCVADETTYLTNVFLKKKVGEDALKVSFQQTNKLRQLNCTLINFLYQKEN